MSIRYFTSLLILATTFSAGLASPGAADRQAAADSLRRELSARTTAKDSIAILYDLLDLSTNADRPDNAEALFATVRRGGDISQQLDVMRRMASAYAGGGVSTKRIGELINITAAMPQSHEQRATLAFLRVEQIVTMSDSLSESKRQEKVHQLISSRGSEQFKDPYDQVELLFMLCQLLQSDIASEQLSKYLSKLGALIEELPDAGNALKNLYFIQASLAYTVSDQHTKAIETSLKFIDSINRFKEKAEAEGHRFRSYDTYYYLAYRRLLNNYPALSNDEIENYYAEILRLAERDADIHSDFVGNRRATIYYLMAKKEYAKVLNILKKQIENPDNELYLNQLYDLMLEAATMVNDREAMLQAALGINRIMHQSVYERGLERVREMEILKEIQDIQNSNIALQNQQRDKENAFHRTMMTIAFTAAALLLVAIFVLLLLFRKSRRLSASLRESNEQLTRERDSLTIIQKELIEARDHARRADRHKTEFINNMSHEVRTPLNAIVECSHLIVDNLDDTKQQYLKRYAKTIDISADMLRTIVTDVLDIAAIDNSVVEIERRPESINAICNIAVDSVRKHTKEGVEMKYLNATDEDISIITDARRVEQVLINLLSNGAKFTDEGFVHLSYRLNSASDDNRPSVTFIVSDTGIGVPKGKEEVIFERFEKLSNLYPGTGLGLNISRMIANLLQGDVIVDTTYPGPGAQFLFTIPI